MTDVEEVLTSPEMIVAVVSVSGRNQLERSKISCLLKLSYWNASYFGLYLSDVIQDLHFLGIFLDIPRSELETIEHNFPRDVVRQKKELVKVWMDSSKQPPSWWHLVQALRQIQQGALAERIREEHGKFAAYLHAP